jgi:hypothetical protein
MEDAKMTKEFKVVTSSTNTNGFGLRGHVLMARDGQAFEIGQHVHNPCVPVVLEKNKVISVPLKNGRPDFYSANLGEITVTPLSKAPSKVAKKVWS